MLLKPLQGCRVVEAINLGEVNRVESRVAGLLRSQKVVRGTAHLLLGQNVILDYNLKETLSVVVVFQFQRLSVWIKACFEHMVVLGQGEVSL